MINDILDTHLIANEKFGLAFESFSLAECLESVVQLNIIQARNIGIEIKLVNNLPTDLSMCSGVNRLRQKLMNLVANSLKFIEKGAITLSADYSQWLETDENPIII
jgi:signal transduction histidine kinase